MCGIAGIQVNKSDHQLTAEVRRELLQKLLIGIEARGKDASGVAYRDNRGQAFIQKDSIKPSILARDLDDGNGKWTTAIAHARFATQGSPKNNNNNHPIEVDSYIGVHNGVIHNDNEIFELLSESKVTRIAEVDTEAVFALLRYGVRLFPESSDARHELLSLVEGSTALAWIRAKDAKDTLYLARGAGSPLTIGHTVGGSVVFASTRSILEKACLQVGVTLAKSYEVAQGTAIRVIGGRVAQTDTFTPDVVMATTYEAPNYNRGKKYSTAPIGGSWLKSAHSKINKHYTPTKSKITPRWDSVPSMPYKGDAIALPPVRPSLVAASSDWWSECDRIGDDGTIQRYEWTTETWIDDYGTEYDAEGFEVFNPRSEAEYYESAESMEFQSTGWDTLT